MFLAGGASRRVQSSGKADTWKPPPSRQQVCCRSTDYRQAFSSPHASRKDFMCTEILSLASSRRTLPREKGLKHKSHLITKPNLFPLILSECLILVVFPWHNDFLNLEFR